MHHSERCIDRFVLQLCSIAIAPHIVLGILQFARLVVHECLQRAGKAAAS